MAHNNAVFLLVCDGSDGDRRVVSETLSRAGVVDVLPLGSRDRPLRRPSWLVVDVDLSRFESVALLRDLIRQDEVGGAPRMFVVDAGDHQAETQALALQADRLIVRPIHPQSLLTSLRADMAAGFKKSGSHTGHGSGVEHGLLNPKGPESGDLPNIYAAADGAAKAEVFIAGMKLIDIVDADGTAVIIHAKVDDHVSQPIGGAGDRVACGVIKKSE